MQQGHMQRQNCQNQRSKHNLHERIKLRDKERLDGEGLSMIQERITAPMIIMSLATTRMTSQRGMWPDALSAM